MLLLLLFVCINCITATMNHACGTMPVVECFNLFLFTPVLPMLIDMDKNWMRVPRSTDEFREGVKRFIEFGFANSAEQNRIV
jgi:hypothetical protein